MFNKGRLTLKIFLFLVMIDMLEAFTHYCFKRGASAQADFAIASFRDALLFSWNAILSPFLWMGLVSVFLIFLVWATILSKIDLSVAVPVCSFSYVFIPLVSIAFLGESVSGIRWAGIFFILMGVIAVSFSSEEKGASRDGI
jgi:drug/metabolite transporter (DMT)-like permease